MHDLLLQSGWDSFLYGAPVVGMLFLSVFKLDSLVSMPKPRLRSHRPLTGTCADGQPLGCDPDGRVWPTHRRL